MMRTVDRIPATTDLRLRGLLRASRKACRLSQQDAARLARFSPVYWQKIESGAQPTAPHTTLAAMFMAVQCPPEKLRAEGYPAIAAAMDELIAAAPPAAADPEAHLAATPGATDEEISALRAVWRAMRAGRRQEPFEAEFQRTKRQPDGQ